MNMRSLFGFLPPLLLCSDDRPPVIGISRCDRSVLAIRKGPSGGRVPALAVGDTVKTGTRIFGTGGEFLAFSSATGTVEDIRNLSCIDEEMTAVVLHGSGDDEWDHTYRGIEGYRDMEPGSLFAVLRDVGLCPVPSSLENAGAIVLNCMESDLLVSINGTILDENHEAIRDGLGLLARAMGADTAVIVAPKGLLDGVNSMARGDDGLVVEVREAKPIYPAGMNELIPRVLPRGRFPRPLIVTPWSLLSMMTYLEKGYPPLDRIITLIDGENKRRNLRVRIGTPVSHLLREANVKIGEGDKLVIGGPMRGVPAFHAEFPVMAEIDAIMVQDRDRVVPLGSDPCTGCGKCVAVCPMRLQPHLLGRYSEFALFNRCADYDIDFCIECGMCAYVCPARRALVQYIVFAKRELAKIEGEGDHGDR